MSSLTFPLVLGGGFNAASPPAIGSTTPAAITGTTVTATTQFNVGASDVVLARDAAGILAQRNGANAQKLKVYRSYVDSSNGSWIEIDANSNGNAYIGTNKNGSGVSSPLYILLDGTARWSFDASGNFATAADNATDIGASGATRPRNLYLGSSLVFGSTDANISRFSAGVIAIGTGAQGSIAGSILAASAGLTGTLGVRSLTTLTDGADGTNTSGYKFVSFVSNSAEAGNVIRVGTTAAVVFTTTSDRDLKNVKGASDLNAAADRIMSYRMRDFEWKSQPGTIFCGPVAQEVYAVNRDQMLVTPGKGTTPWSVNMVGFIPDLIMMAQRNEARLAALEARYG